MPAPAMSNRQNHLLDALLARVERWAARTSALSQVQKASVVSVTAGGAADGVSALVVINWRGTNVAVPYLASYSPTVADVVAVARTGSQLLILGRIAGTP